LFYLNVNVICHCVFGLSGTSSTTKKTEQQQQKCEKRQRTRTYTVVENYSGSWVPITKGWRVLCHPPFTDEPRIPLQKGNTILVTRWRRSVL